MTEPGRRCTFPGCEHPVAPPPATGGRSLHCERPDHNRTAAYAERRRLAAHGDGDVAVAVEERSAERPASLATASLGEIAGRLTGLLERFGREVDAATEALSMATDAETIALERQAVLADARRDVAAAEATASTPERMRALAEAAAGEARLPQPTPNSVATGPVVTQQRPARRPRTPAEAQQPHASPKPRHK